MKTSIAALGVIITLSLGACSQNTSDLTEKSRPTIVTSKENYQAVYRRLSKQYDCSDGAWAGAFASFQVDRQLYTELGFGELAFRLSNLGMNNYYSYIKVSQDGNGSRTEIYTGNTLAAPKEALFLSEIASGARQPNCNYWG